LAAATGARTIGLDFDWRRIEPERGRYDWQDTDEVVALAKRHGLRLAPMLLYTPRWATTAPFAPLDYHRAPPADYALYRDFVHAVVSRYKPRGTLPLTADGYGITDWVMWNEPNVHARSKAPEPGEFWTGSLNEYLDLLRAGYEGAHAADPGCNVLNGGLADVVWAEGEADLITALTQLYDPNGDGDARDGGRPFFDTLNVHTYQPGAPDANWYKERLEVILQVMTRFGDAQKPVWITETGYGSVSSPSTSAGVPGRVVYVSEETQADAVRLIFETSSAYPQVKRVFWWSLRDYYSDASANNEAMEAHYGLLRANFSPKPAYLVYGQLTGHIDQVLTMTATTDGAGVARVTIPASFIAQPGTYVVFANLVPIVQELDNTSLTAVDIYTIPSIAR
jgi:GH35 family endo-1,4-beta-xylanase